MRTRNVVLAVVASSAGFAFPVVGRDCRFVATTADHRLVSTAENGIAITMFAKGEQGHWAAAWSPDGTQVLYSAYPRVHGDPVDLHLANADGTDVGILTVTATEPRTYDIEGISEIHWLDDASFWYVARIGHQGAYVDVWHIGPQFARSALEARLAVAGGPCSLSPDLKSLACVGEDRLAHQLGINVFDYRRAVGGEPPPELGTAEDAAYTVIAGRTRKDDADAQVEGGLHWDNAGQLLFALRRGEKLEVGTLDRPQVGSKSWRLNLQEVTGVEGGVTTIRKRGRGYEIVTASGVFASGGDRSTPSAAQGSGSVVAQKVSTPEPLSPAGRTQLSVLDRWCPGTADRVADRAVDN